MAEKKSPSRAEAVRQAVEQAFQTQVPRNRIQELADDLAHTAARLRGAVDELRPASAEEVKGLRADLRALERRVEALEATPTATRKRPPAAKKRAAAPRKTSGRGTSASEPPTPPEGSA